MIDLHKLSLDGFLSYDKLELLLNEPGITIINGETGSGKSAIFEAIFYLLFGKTLRKKNSVDDLINKVLNKGYEISLEFYIDNILYKITETRDRNGTDLYFYINDSDNRGKTSLDTRKNILKTIDITSEEFKNIAFLGQKQSQILIDGTSANKGDLIIEIFGLQKYDIYIKACEEDLKNALKERDILSNKINEYEIDLKSLKNSLNFNEIEINENIDEIKDKISKIEKKLVDINNIEIEVRSIIKRHEVLLEQKSNIEKLNKEIIKLEQKLNEIPKNKDSLIEIENKLKEHKEQKFKISADINKLKQDLSKTEKLINECPITNNPCPINIPKDFKNKRIDEFKKLINENAIILEKHECNINVLAHEFNNENTKCSIIKEINTKKEISKNYTPIDTNNIEKEKVTLNRCLTAKEDGTKKLKQLNNIYIDVSSKHSLKQQQSEINAKINNALIEKQNFIDKTKKTLEDLSIYCQYLSASTIIFRKAKMYRIDLVLDLLNKNLQEQLDKISDYTYKAKFISQRIDSSGKKLLDNLDIIVNDGMKELPIGMWSGGQITQVGLAVLLGIWKTTKELSIKNISSLWLDEPFGTLSKIVDRVFEVITDLSKELGAKSVKIISHKSLDSRLFDSNWKVELKNGISYLTVYNNTEG